MTQEASLYREAVADTPVGPTYDIRNDQGQKPSCEQHSTPVKTAGVDSRCSGDVVRAEAASVKAKFVSHVDTTTEVVVRFDFLSEQDTRVSDNVEHSTLLLMPSACMLTASHGCRLLCSALRLLHLLDSSYCWSNSQTY